MIYRKSPEIIINRKGTIMVKWMEKINTDCKRRNLSKHFRTSKPWRSSSQYQVLFPFFYFRQSSHGLRGVFMKYRFRVVAKGLLKAILRGKVFWSVLQWERLLKKKDFARVTSASLKPRIGILERKHRVPIFFHGSEITQRSLFSQIWNYCLT